MNKQIMAWIVCILIMASIGYTVLDKVGVGEVVRVIIALALTISACVMVTLVVGTNQENEQEDTTEKNKKGK